MSDLHIDWDCGDICIKIRPSSQNHFWSYVSRDDAVLLRKLLDDTVVASRSSSGSKLDYLNPLRRESLRTSQKRAMVTINLSAFPGMVQFELNGQGGKCYAAFLPADEAERLAMRLADLLEHGQAYD